MSVKVPKIPKIPARGGLLSSSLEQADDILSFPAKEEKPEIKEEMTGNAGLIELEFDRMSDFSEHRFKLYEGKRLKDMVDSVRTFGILQPLIVWFTEGAYILLSGYNRRNAGYLAGIKKGPVIIKKDLTFEDAVLIMTETNLRQRSFSDLSESERAFCLKQHYEAIKNQGRRNDLIAEIERLMNPYESNVTETSDEISRSSGNRAELAEEYNLTEDKLAKYIRIGGYLDISLMELFDTHKFSISVANILSFILDKDWQRVIAELMTADNYKIDGKKADLLRSYYESGKLTDTMIAQILSGEKGNKPKSDKPQPFKVKPAVISKYFTPRQTVKEIEEIIDQALALYFENQGQETEVTA